MKQIYIYMKDKSYANKLYFSLKSVYNDLNLALIDDIKGISEKSLIISDIYLENYTTVNLRTEKDKYQRIDKIYSLILEKSKQIEKHLSKSKIISFINLQENLSENPILTNLAIQKSLDYKTLLLNFNYLHNYLFNSNELGIESLLFSSQDDVEFNKYNNLYYLNSSNLLLQTEKIENHKKILEIVKKSEFNYIFLDVAFSLNQNTLDILNISNSIIFYLPSNIKLEIYNSFINFINNHVVKGHKHILKKIDDNYYLETYEYSKKLKDIKELLNEI